MKKTNIILGTLVLSLMLSSVLASGAWVGAGYSYQWSDCGAEVVDAYVARQMECNMVTGTESIVRKDDGSTRAIKDQLTLYEMPTKMVSNMETKYNTRVGAASGSAPSTMMGSNNNIVINGRAENIAVRGDRVYGSVTLGYSSARHIEIIPGEKRTACTPTKSDKFKFITADLIQVDLNANKPATSIKNRKTYAKNVRLTGCTVGTMQ